MSVYTPLETSSKTLLEVMSKASALDSWEGIPGSALERFGAIYTEEKEMHFPYSRNGGLAGFKVRRPTDDHTKRFYAVGDLKEVDLFGENLIGGKDTLVLTEGEKDCISAYTLLGDQYDYLSIPTGATIKQDGTGVIHKGVYAKENLLRKYKKVYLCLDQDAPGQAVAKAIAQWLGPQCHIVEFSENDVNELLKSGGSLENAINRSQSYRPQRILTPTDLWEDLLKEPQLGTPTPWPSLNRLTGGLRLGEITGVGAGVKVGKTNMAMQLTEHLVNVEGEKVGLFYLENTPLSTMQIVGAKMLGDQSLSQGKKFSEAEADKVIEILEDKVYIFDHHGAREWPEIKSVITWLALSEGVRYFFLDPLTAMIPGDASAANAFLNDLFKELTSLCLQLGIHVVYFSHLNPPKTGNSHEEGGLVSAIQFTGSRAMIRYSNTILGIERNVSAEDETYRNTATYRVLLNRYSGKTGQFPVYFNQHTGAFLETPPPITQGSNLYV